MEEIATILFVFCIVNLMVTICLAFCVADKVNSDTGVVYKIKYAQKDIDILQSNIEPIYQFIDMMGYKQGPHISWVKKDKK
jgi:hypothetical protein